MKEIETEKEAEAARKRASRGGPSLTGTAAIAATTAGVDAGAGGGS